MDQVGTYQWQQQLLEFFALKSNSGSFLTATDGVEQYQPHVVLDSLDGTQLERCTDCQNISDRSV